MTAPAYPAYPPQAPPQYPQQFPPPAPPAYPPQYAQQQFPVAQGYPAPQMAAPQAPLAQGTIDDFFSQPSAGGGKSLSFKTVGTRYVGIVTRPLGHGDVQQQTDTTGRPLFFRDGRPKFVMKVPLQTQPSVEFPDGLATWFVKGQARDELVRAMAEVGAPAGPPEPGSVIDVTYVGDRASGVGFNPAKQFRVTYTRPQGASTAPPAASAPAQQPAAPVAAAIPPQPPAGASAPIAPPAQPVPVQSVAATPAPPSSLTPDQQDLLTRLTGGQSAASVPAQ